jgi:hypothetical protein
LRKLLTLIRKAFVKFVKTEAMEAIRRILTPKSRKLQITIPENLVNEELEVIILSSRKVTSAPANGYKSLKGKLTTEDMAGLLNHVEESRKEWT